MKVLTKGKYYGNQDAKTFYDGILLSQYTYTGDRTDWHYHENPYFMVVLQGNMTDCNKKTKTLCPPGSIMFNNWQEIHFGAKHSPNASGFHLEFEKSWFKKNGISLNLLEGSQLIENPQTHFLFAKLYREFILSDTYSKVSIEILLLEICESLQSLKQLDQNTIPSWIFRLKELLHDDPSDLNLKYLSDQLGIHPVHISRYAPRYLSTSLGAYIRQLKLTKAIPLLLDSNYSLTQIAYACGFADQSHFNRVFKYYFHMNPSAYRKCLH